jgi:hypothetical protein
MLMSVSVAVPFVVHMGSVQVPLTLLLPVQLPLCSVRYHLLEALPGLPHCTIGQCSSAILPIWTLRGLQCLTLS